VDAAEDAGFEEIACAVDRGAGDFGELGCVGGSGQGVTGTLGACEARG
jgi:hypothetical protein